jgi:hypothetical protein
VERQGERVGVIDVVADIGVDNHFLPFGTGRGDRSEKKNKPQGEQATGREQWALQVHSGVMG